MKNFYSFLFFIFFTAFVKAQGLYFPPTTGNTWETQTPKSLNWCDSEVDNLYNFLENTNSKAFIVLKDGKIVLEKYFGNFKQDSIWYWASAGKSLTAFMVGMAQQEGKLNINDKTSKYLGNNWSSLTLTQEDKITIRHQLTMTTGLNDGVINSDCTQPNCLIYKVDAGTRWAYHNAPYTLLDKVIEKSTGTNLNVYISNKLKNTIGLTGLFVKVGDNNVFFSTPRSMARFGLLMLNKGKWSNTSVLNDMQYYNDMINTSQKLNESYGYLWWLNGKNSMMVPGLQTVFNFSLNSNSPKDAFAALGKNGQIIYVVPSQGIVMIRMGNSDGSPVPITYLNDIWKNLNKVICEKTDDSESQFYEKKHIFPNPTNGKIFFTHFTTPVDINIFDLRGNLVFKQKNTQEEISIEHLSTGIYLMSANDGKTQFFQKIIKY